MTQPEPMMLTTRIIAALLSLVAALCEGALKLLSIAVVSVEGLGFVGLKG